ncbi:hypothetical protein [Metabacillus malikii]|uniref:ABC-type Na+ efflux pump permease subunit n=1 Tax=Metabacillus malikii TaxID=1504265 RepID=A0ABT9ZDY7_9BACI|nr:hypothetical protein [Metabacillus malikii]MDQ0230444.1 ABC-type Na+ efflux pump permease subunit [Metabacillus malikii]
MGNANLGLILYGNILLITMTYLYLFKIRKLIGFQLGMNIANLAGGSFAIVTGVILIYQFPLQFVFITILSTLLGMFVGALFGGLFDYQTLLTGYLNGLMMGLMAPMIGAVASNNTLFLILIEFIFLISFILLLFGAKKT